MTLSLSPEEKIRLNVLLKCRTQPAHIIQRSKILLLLDQNHTYESIARIVNCSTKPVGTAFHKYMSNGLEYALNDRPRTGRSRTITTTDRLTVINLACTKPKDLGQASELWTQRALCAHIHQKYPENSNINNISQSSISRICEENEIKPFKMEYYITKRDPEFEKKMTNVLQIYREIEYQEINNIITVSIDEKTGVQAKDNIADDIMPKIGSNNRIRRDPEYKRLGTVAILSGVNLHTGDIYGKTFDRHRSREFIEFLKELDSKIDQTKTIRLIADNHIIHKSKETLAFINTLRANRFEFVFLPVHGSWLNPIEGIFSKMARTFLKNIRVKTIQELHDRIIMGIAELNNNKKPNNWSKFINKYFNNKTF